MAFNQQSYKEVQHWTANLYLGIDVKRSLKLLCQTNHPFFYFEGSDTIQAITKHLDSSSRKTKKYAKRAIQNMKRLRTIAQKEDTNSGSSRESTSSPVRVEDAILVDNQNNELLHQNAYACNKEVEEDVFEPIPKKSEVFGVQAAKAAPIKIFDSHGMEVRQVALTHMKDHVSKMNYKDLKDFVNSNLEHSLSADKYFMKFIQQDFQVEVSDKPEDITLKAWYEQLMAQKEEARIQKFVQRATAKQQQLVRDTRKAEVLDNLPAAGCRRRYNQRSGAAPAGRQLIQGNRHAPYGRPCPGHQSRPAQNKTRQVRHQPSEVVTKSGIHVRYVGPGFYRRN